MLVHAFTMFDSERPWPMHTESPLDVITTSVEHLVLRPRTVASRPAPAPTPLCEAAACLYNAEKPLLLLDNGRVEATVKARALVVALDVLTALTINARGLLPADHPLLLGSSQSYVLVREPATEADVVLAIGTKLGETNCDVVFDGDFALGGELIRIDTGPQQLIHNCTSSPATHNDARLAIHVLPAELPGSEASPDSPGTRRAAAMHQRLVEDFTDWSHYHQLSVAILAEWPDAHFVGNSAQTVYSSNYLIDLDGPHR